MSDYKKYHCMECEHLYDEAKGDPDSGFPPGTRGRTYPTIGIARFAARPKVFLISKLLQLDEAKWPRGLMLTAAVSSRMGKVSRLKRRLKR